MRVGILAPDLNPHHGWGSYSLGIIRALQRAGVALTVVTAHDTPQPEDIAALPLLPPVSPFQRAFLLRQVAALPGAAEHLRSCTHIHTLVEPYAPLAAILAGARPLLMTAHGTYARLPERPFLAGRIYRQAFRRAQVIAVSRHTAEVIHSYTQRPPVVIPNGIDATRYLALPRQPSQQPTLLFVGGVKPRKGVTELVRTFADVRARLPDARLWVVGSLALDEAYVHAVRAEIERLSLRDSVELWGRLDDDVLLPLYSQAWAFVLPAQTVEGSFEGFGLALLEASAAGLPVVSTVSGGTADAVRDGETGLLVAQGEDGGLADALLHLLTDPALAMRLGTAGRAHAANQTWDSVAAQVMAVYAR